MNDPLNDAAEAQTEPMRDAPEEGPADGKTEAEERPSLTREELEERSWNVTGHPDILGMVDLDLRQAGYAGRTTIPQLIYLATVTRLLEKPVSVAVHGPSSSGKTFAIEAALAFHPPEAFFSLTGMSEKALYYLDEPLAHRMLVVTELAGVTGGFLAYGLRSLLSEGSLKWVYTDFDNRRTQEITTPGPTGLLTSTAHSVDWELSTRVIAPTIQDDSALTREILRAAAREDRGFSCYGEYHDHQRFLAAGPCGVHIPFAERLAEEIDPMAVRMRRDFNAVLGLTRAHALMHQVNRRRDRRGRVVADGRDYAGVYPLISDVLAQSAERAVPETIRETVEAVRDLYYTPGRAGGGDPVTTREVAGALGLTRNATNRRIKGCLTLGYLEDRGGGGRGQQRLLAPGDPLPEDVGVLPPPEVIG